MQHKFPVLILQLIFSKIEFQESLRHLAAEVGKPRYGSYHIHLTNLLPKASVKQLAEADMQEVVKEIKEIYIDYLPIGQSWNCF